MQHKTNKRTMADSEDMDLDRPTAAATNAAVAGDESGESRGTATVTTEPLPPLQLPPLKEIFHDAEHFVRFFDRDGKARCRCNWCNHDMPYHATKVLCHAAGVSGKGVKTCGGNVPKEHKDRYVALYEKKLGAKARKKGLKHWRSFNKCLVATLYNKNTYKHSICGLYRAYNNFTSLYFSSVTSVTDM